MKTAFKARSCCFFLWLTIEVSFMSDALRVQKPHITAWNRSLRSLTIWSSHHLLPTWGPRSPRSELCSLSDRTLMEKMRIADVNRERAVTSQPKIAPRALAAAPEFRRKCGVMEISSVPNWGAARRENLRSREGHSVVNYSHSKEVGRSGHEAAVKSTLVLRVIITPLEVSHLPVFTGMRKF